MLKRFLLVFLLLSVPVTTILANGAAPVIMVLGDSLSSGYGIDQNQGWVALLQRRMDKHGYPHRVINASITGDTTAGGLFRLDNALKEHQPDIVIVELGGNDGLRGLSLAEMETNLELIIGKCLASNARILLVGMKIPPNYGMDYTTGFENIYTRLAKKHQLPLVPFLLAGVADDNALLLSDRIHPNGDAQGMILENVWHELDKLLGKVRSFAQ